MADDSHTSEHSDHCQRNRVELVAYSDPADDALSNAYYSSRRSQGGGEIESVDDFLSRLPRWKLEAIAEPYRRNLRSLKENLQLCECRNGRNVTKQCMLASVLLGYLDQDKPTVEERLAYDSDDGYELADTCKLPQNKAALRSLAAALRSYYELFERLTPLPHCRRVFKMSEIYVNLSVANMTEDEDRIYCDYRQCLASAFVSRQPVIATGEPGSGKSLLMRKIAIDWPQPYDLVLVARLRELAGQRFDSILEMALSWLERKIGQTVDWADIRRHLTPIILARRIRLLVVLDGLDEVDADGLCTQLSDTLYSADSALLPFHLLITSRPYKLHNISLSLYQKVILQRFNKKQVEEYVVRHFDKQAQCAAAHEPLMRLLHNNHRLDQLSRIPLMLACICNVHNAMEVGNQTELFDCICEWMVRRSGCCDARLAADWKQMNFVKPLGRLALHFLTDGNSMLFNPCHLKHFDVKPICFEIGFLNEDMINATTGEIVSQFLYKMFQEYFAALCISDDLQVIALEQGLLRYDEFVANNQDVVPALAKVQSYVGQRIEHSYSFLQPLNFLLGSNGSADAIASFFIHAVLNRERIRHWHCGWNAGDTSACWPNELDIGSLYAIIARVSSDPLRQDALYQANEILRNRMAPRKLLNQIERICRSGPFVQMYHTFAPNWIYIPSLTTLLFDQCITGHRLAEEHGMLPSECVDMLTICGSLSCIMEQLAFLAEQAYTFTTARLHVLNVDGDSGNGDVGVSVNTNKRLPIKRVFLIPSHLLSDEDVTSSLLELLPLLQDVAQLSLGLLSNPMPMRLATFLDSEWFYLTFTEHLGTTIKRITLTDVVVSQFQMRNLVRIVTETDSLRAVSFGNCSMSMGCIREFLEACKRRNYEEIDLNRMTVWSDAIELIGFCSTIKEWTELRIIKLLNITTPNKLSFQNRWLFDTFANALSEIPTLQQIISLVDASLPLVVKKTFEKL